MTELVVQRCTACGHVAWPPRLLCPACGASSPTPVPAGRGLVRERTDTRTPGGEPVALVTVELDAGPWVIARTESARPGDGVALEVSEPDGAIDAIAPDGGDRRHSAPQPGDS